MGQPRKRRAAELVPPTTKNLPRPPPPKRLESQNPLPSPPTFKPPPRTATPVKVRRGSVPALPVPPSTPKNSKNSADSVDACDTGDNVQRARKRARAANCEKILKTLADQALNVMRGKGMTPEKENRISPPLSPRSFLCQVGMQLDGPSMPLKATKDTPGRAPLASLSIPASQSSDDNSSNTTKKTQVQEADTPNQSATSKTGRSITPARVQAARCLLSFTQ